MKIGKRSEHTQSIFGGAGFYIVLLLCITAVGVGGYFALFPKKAPPEQPVPVVQPVVPPKVVALAPELPVSAPIEVPVTVTMPDVPVVAEPPMLIVRPVAGEVTAAFSSDELRYDETLEDWRTHDGCDITAPAGTNVLAACAGTVDVVYDDALMGTTVEIAHQDGYRSLYACLQAVPTVQAGDKVTAGQVIGAVGETAIKEAGAHLHFAVEQDGDPVDPELFLKK